MLNDAEQWSLMRRAFINLADQQKQCSMLTHSTWAHDVVATLNQRRNNVMCLVWILTNTSLGLTFFSCTQHGDLWLLCLVSCLIPQPLPTIGWKKEKQTTTKMSLSCNVVLHNSYRAYKTNGYIFNPLTAKLFNPNFYPLEVVSRWRDPQLQVSENYSDLTKWRSIVLKYCWFMSYFIFNIFNMRYLMC